MNRFDQKGATLVEMAIVLTIIGVLVAIVSLGRGTLDSARVSNLVSTAKDLSSAAKIFREKYKYWPGDYPNASAQIANLPASCNIAPATANIGNGAIDTVIEIDCAIEELLQAGLIRAEKASATDTYHTLRVEGYTIRLVSASAANVTTFPAGVNVIEFANLPCTYARMMDGKLDDGDVSLGNAHAAAACEPGGANDPVSFYAVAGN